MKARLLVVLLILALSSVLVLPANSYAQGVPDYPVSNGHYYTQGTGNPGGSLGFRITDDGGIPFWSEFQRLGGPDVLGFPISQRFVFRGFVHQATQKAVLQWQPESHQVAFLNVFDLLHEIDKDDTLLAVRSTPRPLDFGADETGRAFSQVVANRLSLLQANPAIQARYFAVSSVIDPMLIYGLPTSGVEDMGDHFAIRLQRAVIQLWKIGKPWAAAGETTIANGGEIAREFSLIPAGALEPVGSNALDTVDVPSPGDQFAGLIDAAKPSIVRIVVPGNGFGSGIIFDSGGLVLTNHHVVGEASTVWVEFPGGEKLNGVVLGIDPLVDVAVVRVNASGLHALPLGNSEAVRPGDAVLAIGYTPSVPNPPSARTGEVLSFIRPDHPVDGIRVASIESNVFLHPGDSGGPLINSNGEVVGLNTSILFVPGNETVVVSQSLAINLAKMAIEQIVSSQRSGQNRVSMPPFTSERDYAPAVPPYGFEWTYN